MVCTLEGHHVIRPTEFLSVGNPRRCRPGHYPNVPEETPHLGAVQVNEQREGDQNPNDCSWLRAEENVNYIAD